MNTDENGMVTLTPRSDKDRIEYLEQALFEAMAESNRLRRELETVTEQLNAAKRLLETPGISAVLFRATPAHDASDEAQS